MAENSEKSTNANKPIPAFEKFEILLDQPFFVLDPSVSHTTVSGELRFKLNYHLPDTELIALRFFGGFVGIYNESKRFRCLNRLFDTELILWEPSLDHPSKPDPTDESDPRSPLITKKMHSFRFSIKFPSNSPPSLNWSFGKIDYYALASFMHEPVWQFCCGGMRLPILGYRPPDIVRVEIVLFRLPSIIKNPQSSVLDYEKKVGDELYAKDSESWVCWRPSGGDLEVMYPKVVERAVGGKLLQDVAIKLDARRECRVLKDGREVLARVVSLSVEHFQIERYELTHYLQMFDEPVELDQPKTIQFENSLRPSHTEKLELPKDTGRRLIHEFSIPFSDHAEELKIRGIDIVDDVKVEESVSVKHVARLKLLFKLVNSNEDFELFKDIPILLYTAVNLQEIDAYKEVMRKQRELDAALTALKKPAPESIMSEQQGGGRIRKGFENRHD